MTREVTRVWKRRRRKECFNVRDLPHGCFFVWQHFVYYQPCPQWRRFHPKLIPAAVQPCKRRSNRGTAVIQSSSRHYRCLTPFSTEFRGAIRPRGRWHLPLRRVRTSHTLAGPSLPTCRWFRFCTEAVPITRRLRGPHRPPWEISLLTLPAAAAAWSAC